MNKLIDVINILLNRLQSDEQVYKPNNFVWVSSQSSDTFFHQKSLAFFLF